MLKCKYTSFSACKPVEFWKLLQKKKHKAGDNPRTGLSYIAITWRWARKRFRQWFYSGVNGVVVINRLEGTRAVLLGVAVHYITCAGTYGREILLPLDRYLEYKTKQQLLLFWYTSSEPFFYLQGSQSGYLYFLCPCGMFGD